MLHLGNQMMNRAFVIKLTSECDPASRLCGRVEHVSSGQALRFDSLDQFLQFVVLSVENEKRNEAQEREAAADSQL